MSWDPVWEEVFAGREWGRYPPLELVRFVAGAYYHVTPRRAVRILEVGCGAGANLWYLAREGFDVSGIDGSPTAIARAEALLRQEGLRADLRQGDVIDMAALYAACTFDAVVDIACLWCNRLADVRQAASAIHQILKPGGRFFSMLLAQGSSGEGTGREIEPGTFVEIPAGPLAGTGTNHFFSEAEVRDVFRAFAEVRVEYSIRSFNRQAEVFKLWVVDGLKA